MLKWTRSFSTDMSERGSYSGSVLVDKHVGNIRGQQRVAPQQRAWGQGFYSTPSDDAQPQIDRQSTPLPPPPLPQQQTPPGANVAPEQILPAETGKHDYRFSRMDSGTTMTENSLYESHIQTRPAVDTGITGQEIQGHSGLVDSGTSNQAQMPQTIPSGQNQMYDTFIHAREAHLTTYDTFISSQGALPADLQLAPAAYNLQGRYQLSGNTLPPKGIASPARQTASTPNENTQLPHDPYIQTPHQNSQMSDMESAVASQSAVDAADTGQQIPQSHLHPAPESQIPGPVPAASNPLPTQPLPQGQHRSHLQGSLGSISMSIGTEEEPEVVDLRKEATLTRVGNESAQGQTSTLPGLDFFGLTPAQTASLLPAQTPSLTLEDVERSRTAQTLTTPGGSIISPGAKLTSVEGAADLRLVNSLSPETGENSQNLEWVDLRATSSLGRLDNYHTAPPGLKTGNQSNLQLPALTHSPQLGASASAMGDPAEPKELVLGPQEPHRWSASGTLPTESGLPQNGMGRGKSPSIVTAHSSYSDLHNGGVLYTAGLENGTAITQPIDRKQSQTTQTSVPVLLNPTTLNTAEPLEESPDESKPPNGKVANGKAKTRVIRIRPTPLSAAEKEKQRKRKWKIMKILFLLALFVMIVAAIALGVVFGLGVHRR